MERTTLVRALKPLQRDGLVAATAAPDDARTHVFSLTAHGEGVLDEAAVAWTAAQREFHDRFGGARAKALRTELFDLTAAA
jgi:DNA-binding MarR family transcriptional regulator